MVRWRGGRRSKIAKKRSQLQAYLTAPSLGLEPRPPHQLAGKASTLIGCPGFRTQATAWMIPEVHHCANAFAALPIS